MKSRILFFSTLVFTVLFIFSSCSDDDKNDNITPPQLVPNGAYVINSGGKGNNAASITYYDLDSKQVRAGIFESVNGIGLGDTGESMIVYGNKIYVAVYNSGIIYVLDKNCKILSTIQSDTADKIQPRELEAYNGKIYVSLYEGYLARIDTTTMKIDKKIAVGPNPESVKAANNKIYVANSGGMNSKNGYNNTVSVVDTELTSSKEIEVGMNPQEFKMDKYNNLYLISRGNYKTDETAVPNKLQQINTTTDKVNVLEEGHSFLMFPYGDKLYLVNKVYVNSIPVSTVSCYNITEKKVVEENFITDGTVISDISGIEFEPTSGDIYVLAANKKNNGDVYVFSSAGKLQNKFDTGGSYPMGISFIKK